MAIRCVLRPLVKLMLARGVTYIYLADLLKGLFVEVADKEFRSGNKPSTDSHISLVSGVHRKDVKRLRRGVHSNMETIPAVVSLGTRLVSLWANSPRYQDENSRPKPLPRFISEGGDISFEGLVATVSSDIRSRAVLDEWLRLGVVHFDDQRRVCLNVEAFIPAKGFDEKAFYLGHNLHDHAAAAVYNLLEGTRPFLERSVHYDALSIDSITALADQSEKLGMQALLAINKNAMELEKRDAAGEKPTQRMTFGIYFFSGPAQDLEPKTDAIKGPGSTAMK
ncbi:hypothetical protein EBAPG3_014010 [Nitrosospira lacus]|uniref:Uncharacterized protein n=1 Tax=Nitrosospira lacus TaxID=1288494 RepID=A0A1W6SSL2_9PROT|nr:DUF6502 family protein [Nitrosospira lacus]ARO88792.1 hypothetical protein EBAPG3_014010 [Nitrosospira lacus]